MAGEWSETMAATVAIQTISNQVKPKVEKMTTLEYAEFKAVVYRKQPAAGGDSFLIKVQVAAENFIHLSLLQEPAGVITLYAVQKNKASDAPLIPFIN